MASMKKFKRNPGIKETRKKNNKECRKVIVK